MAKISIQVQKVSSRYLASVVLKNINYIYSISSKEHNHVFAHAPDFDFWTGCREFKDSLTLFHYNSRCHFVFSADV